MEVTVDFCTEAWRPEPTRRAAQEDHDTGQI